jgi:hypothetical protein
MIKPCQTLLFKKKHPRKGEKKKQWARTKVQASKEDQLMKGEINLIKLQAKPTRTLLS